MYASFDYQDGEYVDTILVHPIPEDTDSQIEGLSGEDITTDGCVRPDGFTGPV